ncbi:hypothetical protein RHSIM_Rhsim04G0095600 [Rhododendron simsii]|uniref:Uncharacterized protein n=1 Tax=Rhododendron simsii TaxID=118357 RepID=A0A834H0K1_RHOSS|nr:hypothetical protein RHSIM_Rhsim04G0095600 [Rhododendron simsii]
MDTPWKEETAFECGEVPYPHLASGEKGKSFQNRTVNDVKFMWDDGGLRKHLMMINNKSSTLVSMDGNITLLQMSKFTGSLALMNFNITEKARRYDSQGTPICGIEGEVIDVFALSISKVSFAITFEVVKAFLIDQLVSYKVCLRNHIDGPLL